MSNVSRVENVKQLVMSSEVETSFNQLAVIHGAVNYKKEASFALQALDKNIFLRDTAMGNPDSLKRAVVNVAAIGLTLNPVFKYAYLVPRDKEVILDISYRGFIQLAVEAGAIKGAGAELVCKKDKFVYKGMYSEPMHEFDPFGDRGDILGGYCVAKTCDNGFIVVYMPIADIFKSRARSASYASGKNSPWKTDETEMIKKTLIRRAWKSWPLSDTRESERIARAIDVTSENESDYIEPEAQAPQADQKTEDLAKIRSHLITLGKDEAKFIDHLRIVNNREIKNIEDLTELERSKALILLNQFVDALRAKEEAKLKEEKEKKSENVS